MSHRIATGFNFRPLADGNVCIEFRDDGGQPVHTQVITGDAFKCIPWDAFVMLMALGWAAEVAEKLGRLIQNFEEIIDGIDE